MSNPKDFVIENGILTKYNGPGGDVVIPEGVTETSWQVFKGCSRLKSIQFPEGFQHLGKETFYGCTQLEEVFLPGTVNGVINGCFYGCTSLKQIKIPEGITELSWHTFNGCTSLIAVRLPETLQVIGPYCFYGCEALQDIVIPESITEIDAFAFQNCSSLTAPRLPAGITRLMEGTFMGCTGLKQITLPNNLKELSISDDSERFLGNAGTFENCTSLTDIILPDNLTYLGKSTFMNCTALESIVIPESITQLLPSTFYNCTALKNVVLPSSLTLIASPKDYDQHGVFENCTSLISITLPDSVTEMGEDVYRGCSGLTDFLMSKGIVNIKLPAFKQCCSLKTISVDAGNVSYCDVDGVLFNKERTKLIRYPAGRKGEYTVPDTVKEICAGAFADCYELNQIILPKGSRIKLNRDMMTPVPNIARHLPSLLPNIANDLLTDFLSNKLCCSEISVNMMTSIFLKKQSKQLLSVYQNIIESPDGMADCIMAELTAKSSPSVCKAVYNFFLLFYSALSPEQLEDLFASFQQCKEAKEYIKLLKKNDLFMQCLNGPVEFDSESAEAKIISLYSGTDTVIHSLDQHLNTIYYNYYGKAKLPKIKEKSGKRSKDFVLQWLLTVHESNTPDKSFKVKYGYWMDLIPKYEKPGVCPEAQQVLDALDSDSLQDALKILAEDSLGHNIRGKKIYLGLPIARYAKEPLMLDLTSKAPKWRSGYSGNDAPGLLAFRTGCLFSETRAAMMSADRFGDLPLFAMIRNTDEDTIRDKYLSDIGINESGEKVYDLGNQTVRAVLQPDLSFLICKADGKTTKSLPKKDADPEKYAAANADFSEMKKAAKKIVKNRCDILFSEFLTGRSRPAGEWKSAYLQNPLLRSVARLLVWQQADDTFTLTDSGAIRADGTAYEIGAQSILLAHPMEMKQVQVDAWQKYFTSHGLKQPFAQVWEPVIDPAGIKKDRYEGCMIPYGMFRSKGKHGIHVEDEDFHNDIIISFDGCDADVERIDQWRHMIENDHRFEVQSFGFSEYTRQVNHIVAYLDRITVDNRILQDDISIEAFLPSFTLAQITDFIKLATENNCPNVAVLLLNYNNEHFADFDPMEEFTLGEL